MFKFCLIVVVSTFLSNCSSPSFDSNDELKITHVELLNEGKDSDSTLIISKNPLFKKDTLIQMKFSEIDYPILIKVPSDTIVFVGSILALHGWNLPYTDWCDKTTLCKEALSQGYIVVLPEMGKSNYNEKIYPETRKDWTKYPTRKWLIDTLLVFLQNEYQIFLNDQSNYVLGLSTGGRGAVLVALDRPDIFNAVACLSGDFDQTQLPEDNLYRGFYGAFSKFEERWKKMDNVITNIQNFKVPIYLGHGLLDDVTSVLQSNLFYDSLQLYHPKLRSLLHIDSAAKHDYDYWNSEVDAMLNFFQSEQE